jgi:O-methyltransferase
MIKSLIHKSFRTFGLDIVRSRSDVEYPSDFRSQDVDIIQKVFSLTLTSVERIYSLINGVRYLNAYGIQGAIVECGVWKGGSMAAVARTLVQLRDGDRDLYLFDTFEGMSPPTDTDTDYTGKKASEILRNSPAYRCDDAPLESVRNVLYQTGYPKEKIHFVQGKVEDTIPSNAPGSIALLRLDTDWYQSTKHELTHLFPRLCQRGVIVIDDYGHWEGCRKACDEYFRENHVPILLNRIDYTGRIGVKS